MAVTNPDPPHLRAFRHQVDEELGKIDPQIRQFNPPR